MFIYTTRLFHDFQYADWFAQRWVICNYDVECILTTFNGLYTICDMLNTLYYVERFVLSWIICTYNVECVLTTLKDFHWCWMTRTVVKRFETSSWKILPRKLPKTFSPMKILTVNIAPYEGFPCENSSGENSLAAHKKYWKSKIMKIKANGIDILQKSSRVYQHYFRS